MIGYLRTMALALVVFFESGVSKADGPALGPAREVGFGWTGLYLGGDVGIGSGHTDAKLSKPPVTSSNAFGSLYGGLHLGYNHLLSSMVLLGVEADVSFPNYFGADDVVWNATAASGHVSEKIDYLATLRARFGHAYGPWLLYGTGGFAWSGGHFFQSPAGGVDEDGRSRVRTGWVLGAGIERSFERDWTARLEYLATHLGEVNIFFPPDAHYLSTLDIQAVRLGLSYKLGNPSAEATAGGGEGASSAGPDSGRWEIHGQTTYVHQGYPPFHALYSGTNSLTPGGQAKETWTTSAFLGVRLWQGGELYYNPELLQGFGLNSTTGAGGFPNGEAQKSDFLYPHHNTSRLFLRQTFGLGGEQETIESDYGQMADKKDVSRVTVQVGKFAVHDLFDGNAYAQDSREDFLNWSIWAAGAFDYPADKLGLTWGGVIDYNEKNWSARIGYFLVGKEPNANSFDTALLRRGGYVAELESRYQLFSQPGKLRLIGWLHNTFSGSYREAVDLTLAHPGLDATEAIEQTRTGRTKYGYVANLEQAISKDIGVFARWSWNSGTNEISAFTDIDASLSFGTSLKGTAWGRPDDRIGVATAFNALSRDHRDYLAAGGLGILIGDGRLDYRIEEIFETYYALKVAKSTTITFDYQNLSNPAYNADRGPVHVFSGRLHSEF